AVADGLPLEEHVVDAAGRRSDVRMVPCSEWGGAVAEVLGARRDGEAVVVERVVDLEAERERIARLWMHDVLDDDARRLVLDRAPADPARETVDCVAGGRLGQRELVCLSLPHVAAAVDPVRPRHEDGAAARLRDLVDRVAEKWPVLAETAADLDDDRAAIAVRDLVLLARGRDHAVRTASESTISRSTLVSASTSPRRSRARSAASSARRRAPSTPWVTTKPSPSRMSSTIWKSRPSSPPNARHGACSAAGTCAAQSASATDASKSRPVFSLWSVCSSGALPVMSRYCPPIIPSVASASSRATCGVS